MPDIEEMILVNFFFMSFVSLFLKMEMPTTLYVHSIKENIEFFKKKLDQMVPYNFWCAIFMVPSIRVQWKIFFVSDLAWQMGIFKGDWNMNFKTIFEQLRRDFTLAQFQDLLWTNIRVLFRTKVGVADGFFKNLTVLAF